ncbi:hypothetical protein [Moritella viscosa]|uniref:hypothetical protein n=1 Tax=Moritella viscosa TaxID=80854 RepID=UPI00091B6996|nr:hypothetical protein [Moritella viscosa]SGZ15692.1 Putative uncharacterized protein [Moritella viscosa]SHO14429.1 Putative uncharacterized protein [Moritella viscosa]
MKKIIALTVSLFVTNIALANVSDLDLSKYRDDCINKYNKYHDDFGDNQINGTYLKYEGGNKPKFESLYFSPDVTFTAFIGGKEIRIFDLTEKDDVYTFYNKSERKKGSKKGTRTGIQFKLTRVSDADYELEMSQSNRKEYINGKGVYKSYFEKKKTLDDKNNFTVKYVVDEKKSEEMYKIHTWFKDRCLK